MRRAVQSADVALWCWNVDTDRLVLDERAYELWGLPKSDPDISFEDLSRHIHPADRDQVGDAFTATLEIKGPFEIDFRIMIGEEVRWISAKGQGGRDAIVAQTRYGVFLDVTGRKRAEEGNGLLAAEMSHRVKNLLGIAASLANLTARSTDTTASMARELTQRFIALGRAHDLVRPMPGTAAKSGDGTLLADLLSVLLAPYGGLGGSARISISAPRIGVGEAAATALALIVHELATNSMKYGALSIDTGTLDLSCTLSDESVAIAWRERGGPPVELPPGPAGFGSKLVDMSLSRQLGGTIEHDWSGQGLDATLRIKTERLLS